MQIPDVREDPDYTFQEVAGQEGFRAILSVPMIREGRIIGGLSVLRKTPGRFADTEITLLTTFANQCAIAVENARLFREVQDQSQQLEIASRHKSQFLANMSHELRTPMNAIIGFTRLVMRRSKDLLPAREVDNLGKILVSAEHLLGLINGILDLSKIEAGRVEIHPVDCSLEPLVDVCLRTVEPLVKSERTRLVKAIDGDLPRLFTDEDRLKQILINLLSNAVKFTEAGNVTLSVQRHDAGVTIAVADTGIGIPEDTLGRIFEEFRQADSSTTRQYGGTGLGLSISRHLARLMGGDITVQSTVRVGSTFTLTLPLRYAAPKSAPPG